MRQNWIVVTFAGILLAVVSLLTLHLHYEGIEEVLSQFQGHQLSYAKHLSNQIQFFIQARSRGLRALSSFPSLQYGDIKRQKLDIEAYANQIERVYVKTVSLIGELGTVAYSTDSNTIGLKKGEETFFVWALKSENRGKISLTPVFSESQSLTFILAIPLYREGLDPKHPELRGTFAGVLAFTLDMKEFLTGQLGSLDPKMNLDQVWITDRDGTLLFQPDHPEMVSRNIFQREGSCRSCHVSFNYIEEMLGKKEGTVDYQIRSHPKKIASFASMEFENVSWVVVVNTRYDQVTGFIKKKSLRGHLFLIGIVVLASAISSGFLLRKERMKIKAEEEAVHWQEKMAERRKAEEALELERNKLKGILDSMNDGVYIINQQYEILYTNPVIEKEFGPVKTRKCYEYFYNLPNTCSWCKSKEVFAGNAVRWEWHSFKTGRTYDLFDTPIMGPGTLCKLQFIRDISDRKRAEKALRQSEKRYRMLVETLNEGLGVQDENGVWVYVNDRLCEMLGYSREEMIGRPLTSFLSEENQMVYREQVARRRGGEIGIYDLSWLKKDQQTILTLVSPKPIFDERGQFKGSFAVVTDITERKQAEEALRESEKQLRALSSQLLTAQETERKRISRELHDELGQSLTVMKLRLNFIEKNLSKHQTDLQQECEDGVRYIDQIIENIRRLSRDLSPTILDDFGLSAALRWLISNFAKSYMIKVILNMIDVDSLLPPDSHVVIYRTVQEALTNVGKHSQAKTVSIDIHQEGNTVLFSVEDDGIGFDEWVTTGRNPEENGLGLATMKGRAQMVGGVLQVRTQEGKGTRITLSIPIQQGATL